MIPRTLPGLLFMEHERYPCRQTSKWSCNGISDSALPCLKSPPPPCKHTPQTMESPLKSLEPDLEVGAVGCGEIGCRQTNIWVEGPFVHSVEPWDTSLCNLGPLPVKLSSQGKHNYRYQLTCCIFLDVGVMCLLFCSWTSVVGYLSFHHCADATERHLFPHVLSLLLFWKLNPLGNCTKEHPDWFDSTVFGLL